MSLSPLSAATIGNAERNGRGFGLRRNVAIFVRDARLLVDRGYRLVAVTPVDWFRHSAHVNLVGRF